MYEAYAECMAHNECMAWHTSLQTPETLSAIALWTPYSLLPHQRAKNHEKFVTINHMQL